MTLWNEFKEGLHVCYGYPTQFLDCFEERLKQQEHGSVKDYQA